MINSTQYRKHAIKSQYPYMLVLRRYWKPMLGTCKYKQTSDCYGHLPWKIKALAWFCYDFVTYPFGLFSSTIVEQLNPNNTTVQNIGYGVSVDRVQS
jgi:hypothetical protein